MATPARTPAAPLTVPSPERRARREAVLTALREAVELRRRLHPRAEALARSRAVLHARTTRG